MTNETVFLDAGDVKVTNARFVVRGKTCALGFITSFRKQSSEIKQFNTFHCKEFTMDTNMVNSNPEIMSGTLCFTGTRVPVQNLFDYLEGSSSLNDFLEDFPSVRREVAVAVLEAARTKFFANASAS